MKEKIKEIQKAIDNKELIIPLAELSTQKIAFPQYTIYDLRSAFIAGADFARSHDFSPPYMNSVKAKEEAELRWPN